MRKKGFTLAETLITLGVIGIIAAIILPAMTKIKPDGTKAMYLRTQREIAKAIKSYANNSKVGICNDTACYSNYPLFSNPDNKSLCEYLANALGAGSNACSAEYAEFSDDAAPNWSFTTPEGQKFYISTDRVEDDTTFKNSHYLTEIVFDINGDKGVNHMYDENHPEPDRFRMYVTADGKVVPGDKKGNAYVKKEGMHWLKKNEVLDFTKPDGAVISDNFCREGTSDCPVNSACDSTTGKCKCTDECYELIDGECVKKEECKCVDEGGTWNGTSCDYPTSPPDEPDESTVLYCGDTYDGKTLNCVNFYDIILHIQGAKGKHAWNNTTPINTLNWSSQPYWSSTLPVGKQINIRGFHNYDYLLWGAVGYDSNDSKEVDVYTFYDGCEKNQLSEKFSNHYYLGH